MNKINTVLALLVCALMAACGGGDFEDEDRATVQPLDCTARPDLCR